MSRIVLFTCDGTSSLSATAGYDQQPGAGYPASMAQRLDPTVWQWVPVSYHPGFTLGGVINIGTPTEASYFGVTTDPNRVSIPIRYSVDRGVDMIVSAINSMPAGTRWAMSGLSQGAMVTAKVYKEAKYGTRMPGRFADLVAIVEFGPPGRGSGHTVDLPGAIDPGQHGIAAVPTQYSYGIDTFIVNNAEDWYWQFCNLGDLVGAVPAGAEGNLSVTLFDVIVNGTFTSVVDFVAQLVALGIGDTGAVQDFLGQFWLMATGQPGTPAASPHAQYELPYTALTGNTTKTAVDLAVEYMTAIGGGQPWQPLTGGALTPPAP